MKRVLHRLALGIGLTIAAGTNAIAWDTRVIACPPDQTEPCDPTWLSIYRGGASPYIAEHTGISDLSLRMLGLRDIFGKQGTAARSAVDLNASWLRREHFEGSIRFGDDPDGETVLEERRLPAPANYTGVPDYSYSVLDWINKNSFCPPFGPGDYPAACHHFVGWLGGFNSPHFGSQAEAMYKRYHTLALDIAARARELRLRLGTGPEAEAHEDIVKEIELEALSFEGFAQHFLQDRWAMGHMWERWGAGDAAQLGVSRSGTHEKFLIGIGAVAGLLHGTEAVVNDPYGIVQSVDNVTGIRGVLDAADPMSSPVVRNGVVVPMQWRHTSQGEGAPTVSGVGDERFNDVYVEHLTGTGRFGSGYGGLTQRDRDLPFSAIQQFNEMMTCSKAGWAEIVRTFGQNPQGGYGAHKAPLAADAPTFAINDNPLCWDMWATNASIYTGLMDDNAVPLQYVAMLAGRSFFATAALSRAGLLEMAGKMWIRKFLAPNATDLATGGIGELAGIKTADKYQLPNFVMPASVTRLEEENDTGIDRRTLYGLFNRAHSDYWCEELETRLEDLRGSEEEHEQQVCRYLADFAYRGTTPGYEGQQSRQREHEGEPVRSICSVYGLSDAERRDAIPQYLRPGYVPMENPEEDARAYSPPAVGHWCDRVPVLELADARDLANADVVVNIEPGQTDVEMAGLNLIGPDHEGKSTDEAHGSLTLYNEEGFAIADIVAFDTWTDTELKFTLPDHFGADWRTGDFRVEIKRRDGTDSVGRFFLRISAEPPEIESVRATHSSDAYYDTEENIFRPLPYGTVTVEVTFKSDMKTDNNRQPATFLIDQQPLSGGWEDARTWKGTFDHSVKFSSELRSLSIMAQTKAGGWTDTDGETDGNQPDTTHKLLLGTVPPYLVSLTATADGDTIYEATWHGGEDLLQVENVSADELDDVRRTLDLSTTETLPGSGALQLTMTFSTPLAGAPMVTVEGNYAQVTGADSVWTASLDLGALGDIGNAQVEVTGVTGPGLSFDGNPRTQTHYNSESAHWRRYEDGRTTRDARTGGPDRWHILGTPPSISFVIVLDGSGSMDDEDGRMENAKNGIYNLLNTLDDEVEVAVLVFYDCGSVDSVGFTRDFEAVRNFVAGVSPSGSTGLAATISDAREFLISASHPASGEWRAAEFTDGEETCGGDVAGELYRLHAAIAAHGKADISDGVIDQELIDDLEEEVAEEEDPSIACLPDSWESFRVHVEDGGAQLDRIRLRNARFEEEELPDGRCRLALKTETYGVYYGSAGRSGWGINSRPSDVNTRQATSSDGEADIQSLRDWAQLVRDRGTSMENAEEQITSAVERNLSDD